MTTLWTTVGTASGMTFGSTLGGILGAMFFGIVGFIGGAVRDATSQHVLRHATDSWDALTDAQRTALVSSVTTRRQSPTPSAPPSLHPAATASYVVASTTLSDAEVTALGNSQGTPECKVCMDNIVNLCYQPCAHAVVCAACHSATVTLGLRTCVVCRAPVRAVHRVYL
jgi:hypothetical protein